MKIYYKTKTGDNNTEILTVNDLMDDQFDCEMEVENIYDFQNKCKELNLEVDDDIEARVSSLLENRIEEVNGNLEEFEIKHWVSNRSFGELIEMYEEDEITIPIMQRNFV